MSKAINTSKPLYMGMAFLAGLVVTVPSLSRENSRNAWTPENSIGVRYFVGRDGRGSIRTMGARDVVEFDATGKFFFFLSTKGVLKRDSVQDTLEAFRVKDVTGALSRNAEAVGPSARLVLESDSSDSPPIEQAWWVVDSPQIMTMGSCSTTHSCINLINAETGNSKLLLDTENRLYDASFRGGSLVYIQIERRTLDTPYPIEFAKRAPDGSLRASIVPVQGRQQKGLVAYAQRGEQPPVRLSLSGDPTLVGQPISPNGRFIVMSHAVGTRRAFAVVDLSDGDTKDVGFEAQAMPNSTTRPEVIQDVVWSADSRSVAIVNGECMESRPDESGLSKKSGCILIYDVVGRKINGTISLSEGLGSGITRVLGWKDGSLRAISGSIDGSISELTLVQKFGKWTQISSAKYRAPAMDVSTVVPIIRQSATKAPEIVARLGSREVRLTEPDDSLKSVIVSPTTEFSWEEGGKILTGGIVMPISANVQSPVPVVIQVGPHDNNLFLPDGFTPSGYSAQTMAAAGLAVVLIDGTVGFSREGTEGQKFVDRIDAVVAALRGNKRLDLSRVGVVGFSRYGFETFYALTHAGRTKLSAVACLDSFDPSYFSYVASAAAIEQGNPQAAYELANGGQFWENKERWLERDPAFNVDRVDAPALFTLHGTTKGFADWMSASVIGAFRINRKPVEYAYFPSGEHALLRPVQRLTAISLVRDWMVFWLLEKNPSDPERRRIWSELRRQRSSE